MKKSFLKSILLICAISAACLNLAAQMHRGPRGGPKYDPATEVTVTGTVEAVQQIAGGRAGGGTHLTLKTSSGTFDVHVGPSWFLDRNNMSFAKGDQIEVTGSKVKFADGEALLARQIKKGDKVLTLRNAQGIPEWSGGRRAS